MASTRWYAAISARGSRNQAPKIHAAGHGGAPICGTTAGRTTWHYVKADATCPKCQLHIERVVALGPAAMLSGPIERA